MLPRLTAEESLTAAVRTAVGSGALKRDDASRIQDGWQRDANPSKRRKAPRATPEQLAAMGIQVVHVAPSPPQE